MARLDIDMNGYEPSSTGEFDPMPAGWYNAHIDESEVVATQGGGSQLKLRFRIEGDVGRGLYGNRTVYARITLSHQDQHISGSGGAKAVAIGRDQLLAIALATTGQARVGDTEELHGHSMRVLLGVDSYTDRYGDVRSQNVIKRYADRNGVNPLTGYKQRMAGGPGPVAQQRGHLPPGGAQTQRALPPQGAPGGYAPPGGGITNYGKQQAPPDPGYFNDDDIPF